MIDPKYFEASWIEKLKEQYPKTDPLLMERTLYAFELLGQLIEMDGDFVFKGGTCLMLLLDNPERLSIDIDILGDFSIGQLQVIIQNSPFNSVIEDNRTSNNIPKKHFKFYFSSQLDDNKYYVLLDIVNDSNPYGVIERRAIRSSLFQINNPRKVTVPTVDGLLGDKLTAFAPNTIGILYGLDKSQEIIKQLFDISLLFENVNNLDEIKHAYQNTYIQANRYRDDQFTIEESLEDTFETGYLISQLDLKGAVENEQTVELRLGLKQISNFLLNTRFTLPIAKAALLATLITVDYKSSELNDIKFQNSHISKLRDMEIQGEYNRFNRLKSITPAGFFYWWLISKIKNEEPIELL